MSEASLFMTAPTRALVATEVRVNTVMTDKTRHTVKTAVHHELLRRIDLVKLSAMQADVKEGREQILALIARLMMEQSVPLSAADRDQLAKEVLDEVFGLGPLEPLLHDNTVSDILVNGHDSVYVERRGRLEKTNVIFKDPAHLMHIIDKIVSAVGRRIDESSPMVDARLLDGSRVNVIIPPLAIDGPSISIRRFGSSPLEADA